MKLVVKRSSTATASAVALAEPEEMYAPPPAQPAPSPAPAGALHRVYPITGASSPGEAATEEYIPQRGSYGARLRGGMPRSLPGRILLGSFATLAIGIVILVCAAVRQFLLHDSTLR